MECSDCGKDLEKEAKITTPKHGILCVSCWCVRMGEEIEEHPISD